MVARIGSALRSFGRIALGALVGVGLGLLVRMIWAPSAPTTDPTTEPPSEEVAQQPTTDSPPVGESDPALPPDVVPMAPYAAAVATPVDFDPLYVAGIAYLGLGGRYAIYLSDGRTLTETDGVVASVSRNHVTLTNGEVLWIGPPRKPKGLDTDSRPRKTTETSLADQDPKSLLLGGDA